MGRRSDIDWEKVEREYRLGKMTFQEMAEKFDVDASSITRRAKKEGWERDLSVQVKLETKAKISAAIVRNAHETHKERISANAQAVEVEAISNALMVAEHEKVGTKSRELFSTILDKISEQVANTPAVETVAKMAAAQDPLALPALRKILALPSYVDSAKKATEGAAKAIEVERKARNLDEVDPNPDEPITVIERRIIDVPAK